MGLNTVTDNIARVTLYGVSKKIGTQRKSPAALLSDRFAVCARAH